MFAHLGENHSPSEHFLDANGHVPQAKVPPGQIQDAFEKFIGESDEE